MTRRAQINTQFRPQISSAAARFRDHEAMSRDKVLSWIEQFEDTDLECGVRVLQNIKYYSAPQIRQMLQRLVVLSYQSLRGVPRNKIYFVPVGRPGGGANVVARGLDDVPGVRRKQIVHMLELDRLEPEEVGGIVFLDDFSGTGNSLVTWWATVEMMVRPKNARFVVAVLVLNHSARDRIKEFAENLVGADHLSENDDSLSALSAIFTEPQKEALVAYCEKTQADEMYLRGFGSCGLLVAFRHGCPNNSLPILWHGSDTWIPLFRRRAM